MVIRARQGVLLAAGGFAHNGEMREQYGADQPNRARWSISNPGDTGEVLQAAMRLGAKTDLMDEAWWLPSPRTGRFGESTLDQARQRPGTVYVDAAGSRFVNESNSYMEVGKAMYARDKTSRAVPCWLIFDDRYRKRYAHARSCPPGRIPRKLLESGLLKQAWTLEDLARMCDIDATGLSETITEFSKNAALGIDPAYGRGESAYNRALGDPNHRVHPCLGPIDQPPFYAVQVVPGDIGTCGGLVTDEHARVVGQDDRPIGGLYATGNGTATVMGRHYLGPGASIANTMVFGYLAAQHATRWPVTPLPDHCQSRVTPSRRTVMACVGHFRAAATTLSSDEAVGSTTKAMESSSKSKTCGTSPTQFPDPMHTSRSISTSSAMARCVGVRDANGGRDE